MLRSVVPANPAAFLNKSDSQRKRFGGYIPIGKSPEHGFIFFILFLLCFRSQDNKLGVHFLSWSPDGKYIVFEPSDWLIVHRRVERRACPRLCGSGTPLAVVCTPFCYSRTPSLPSLGVLAHCF